MKSIIRFMRIATPLFVVLSLVSSCKKEECCTWRDSFGDTYSYCEENNALWGQYYTNWDQVKLASTLYGGSCTKQKK